MRRTAFPMFLFMVSLLLLLATTVCTNVQMVNAEADNSLPINIQTDHIVQVRDGGLVVINDTFRLSALPGENIEPLYNFSVGFPFEYSFNLDHCFAYDKSNPDDPMEVVRDVGLGMVGFYGVSVLFPEVGVDLSNGGSYSFTVVFVFSDLVRSEVFATNGDEIAFFTADFPTYPSVTQEVLSCNATVILPYGANYSASSFETSGLDFNLTTQNLHPILNHTEFHLESLSYESAWVRFYALPDHSLYAVRMNEVRRDVVLDEWGHVFLSDFYHLTNKGGGLSPVIRLPNGAYDVSARDESGDLEVFVEEGNATTPTNVTVYKSIAHEASESFTVNCRLPRELYIEQKSWSVFNLVPGSLDSLDWTIRELIVTVDLPEGGELQLDACYPKPQGVQKGVFRETIVFTVYNATPFQDLDFDLTYRYVAFWSSFRPTLWMGVLLAVACVVVFLWRTPKPSSASITPVPRDVLGSFFDSYKEKRRLIQELELAGQQVQKRKISRRRYKVRRRGLESRVSVLSRDLSGIREKIRKAGPRYANAMRQIETAETELEGAEAAIRRIEVRYHHREISAETYRRLLAEYSRKRERAKTAIDGVLLRLREEIS